MWAGTQHSPSAGGINDFCSSHSKDTLLLKKYPRVSGILYPWGFCISLCIKVKEEYPKDWLRLSVIVEYNVSDVLIPTVSVAGSYNAELF